MVCWLHGVLTRVRNPKERTRAYAVVVVREIGNAEWNCGNKWFSMLSGAPMDVDPAGDVEATPEEVVSSNKDRAG